MYVQMYVSLGYVRYIKQKITREMVWRCVCMVYYTGDARQTAACCYTIATHHNDSAQYAMLQMFMEMIRTNARINNSTMMDNKISIFQ